MGGPIYWELLKPGRTVTIEVYCRQLDEVQQKLVEMEAKNLFNKTKILKTPLFYGTT